MPYFDFPPGQRMLWEFTVFRDLDWRRIAAETHACRIGRSAAATKQCSSPRGTLTAIPPEFASIRP
jgi:hypothetical protein